MIQDADQLRQAEITEQFTTVLTLLSDKIDMQKFLRDAMTEKEVIEISARLEAARMLTAGEKYTAIIEKTKLSSRTVARISDWLKNGSGGYQVALNVIDQHHAHLSPDRAK